MYTRQIHKTLLKNAIENRIIVLILKEKGSMNMMSFSWCLFYAINLWLLITKKKEEER